MNKPVSGLASIEAALNCKPGAVLGCSNWVTIDQEMVNRFAACTGDHQWIHIDVERAKTESPFGTTIAHGYLMLSLLPRFSYEIGVMPKHITQALNYGTNQVRFPSPVRVPSKVRDKITLKSLEDKGGGRVLLTLQHSVEIEGQEKPALVADTLTLLFT